MKALSAIILLLTLTGCETINVGNADIYVGVDGEITLLERRRCDGAR